MTFFKNKNVQILNFLENTILINSIIALFFNLYDLQT